MKKKVVIEKVPSSKKKVVIEGLPKAQGGTRVRKSTTVERDGIHFINSTTPTKLRFPSQKSWQNWIQGSNTNQAQPSANYNPNKQDSDDVYYTPNLEQSSDDLYWTPKEGELYETSKGYKKPKTKSKPNLEFLRNLPTVYSGNIHFDKMMNAFKKAGQFASNIGAKEITLPTNYDPYFGLNWKPYKNGGYLPKFAEAGTWGNQWLSSPGFGATQQSYATPPSGLQPLNIQMPQYQIDQNSTLTPSTTSMTEGSQEIKLGNNVMGTIGGIAGTVANIGIGLSEGSQLVAGALGTKKTQDEINKMNAQLTAIARMSPVESPAQINKFEGDNPLPATAHGGKIGYASNGMQIKQIGGYGEPNVEVEGKEGILLPNGFSQEIQGKSHAEGGIPLNLPSGTKIFSEKLKVPVKFLKELIEVNPQYAFLKNIKLPEKGMMSYADLAKKFETKKYVDLLNSKDADPIQKTTAQLMINKNNQALEAIFALQEQNKLSGVHGPQVQQNAEQELAESQSQEQGEMQEEPMMMHGGLHKAQDGTKVPKTREEFLNWYKSKKEEIRNLPSKWDRKANQPTFARNIYAPVRNTLDNVEKPDDMDHDEFEKMWNELDKDLKTMNQYTLSYYFFKPGKEDLFTLPSNLTTTEELEKYYDLNKSPFKQPGTFTGTFTGVNPNVDWKTLRLQESEKERRKQFLPYLPTEIPTGYGSQLGLESVFSDFENTYGVKLPVGTNEQKLQALREYQTKLTPELSTNYKLNFARGNQELYNQYKKSKGYKPEKDRVKESEKFYDWAKGSGKITEDYANRGLWGHEYYNVSPLKFSSQEEYNKWLQDPDWKKVGDYYVDRSADPTQPITYYKIQKPKTVKEKEEEPATPLPTAKGLGTQAMQKARMTGSPFGNILTLPFYGPDVLAPIDMMKLDPNLVEAPIIQPYTYDIDRAIRAGITNATDLSGTGIAQRLQALGTGMEEKGKRYQDAAMRNAMAKYQADLANAQAKAEAQARNQAAYADWVNKKLQALGAMGTQQGLRETASQADLRGAIKEANTLAAIQDAYFPAQKYDVSLGDVLQTSKYGGKVKQKTKSKIKIKPKLRK